MQLNRYKDAAPEVTVARIREITDQLGINLQVKLHERVPGVYSASVTDKQNGWTACGKGSSEAYCLASGFGETIEHLCSYFAYDTSRLSPQAQAHLGFQRYPDEVSIRIREIPSRFPQVFADMVSAYCRDGSKLHREEDVLEVWQRYLGSTQTTAVPWFSVRQRKTVYLPDVIIGALCGSNGGGAGNTPEEAIGHGLDEICERYAKYCIYTRRLTPPTVPDSYIRAHFPDLAQIMDRICANRDFRLVVKDASMGLGLPVVAVLLIDTHSQRYMVNFGAHPRFEIALERCLTEMFQQFSPENRGMKRKDLAKWRPCTEEELDGIRNWVSLLRDDTGLVPDSFFAGEEGWSFIPWQRTEDYSNAAGMRHQLDTLLSVTESDIYIRQISFLGFPVYRVYIPGLSAICIALNQQQLRSYEEGAALVRQLQQGNTLPLSRPQLEALRDQVFAPSAFVPSLIFRNMSEQILNALYAALCYDLGQQQKARDILEAQDDRFCRCASEELRLCAEGASQEKRNTLLELFFGKKELAFAACWREKQVFSALITQFFGGGNIHFNGNSSTDTGSTDTLHMRLKEAMLQHIPDQQEIASLL